MYIHIMQFLKSYVLIFMFDTWKQYMCLWVWIKSEIVQLFLLEWTSVFHCSLWTNILYFVKLFFLRWRCSHFEESSFSGFEDLCFSTARPFSFDENLCWGAVGTHEAHLFMKCNGRSKWITHTDRERRLKTKKSHTPLQIFTKKCSNSTMSSFRDIKDYKSYEAVKEYYV